MVSGILFAVAAGIAAMYLMWWFSARNGDGPWIGVFVGLLVMVGGILRAVGL